MKKIGARERQVGEPLRSSLFRVEAILQVEFEAYPEPKTLLPQDLKALRDKYGDSTAVGRRIGASEGFVRQKLKI